MYGTHLVFVGKLDNYDDWCEMYPNLKEHSTSLGIQEDVLAIAELCNLWSVEPVSTIIISSAIS